MITTLACFLSELCNITGLQDQHKINDHSSDKELQDQRGINDQFSDKELQDQCGINDQSSDKELQDQHKINDQSSNKIKAVVNECQEKLAANRQDAGRSDNLDHMSLEQLQEEKASVQRVLLQFEREHGRPVCYCVVIYFKGGIMALSSLC